ncbi:HNH endonuclease [Pectobacterium atrosepticum]|uniref:HNH endonuclease n=1 Tax=Pectobacterium versatile TaxID=2488639 RepID=UPI000F8DAD0F|nr:MULTISPECIES: HNH endonuclease [Pectobacterium]MCL6373433.1 HNH endonuclease [Pectobacterium atrosepticum]RUR90258.1 HNH endonuclease [Pectobacterium versatile]
MGKIQYSDLVKKRMSIYFNKKKSDEIFFTKAMEFLNENFIWDKTSLVSQGNKPRFIMKQENRIITRLVPCRKKLEIRVQKLKGKEIKGINSLSDFGFKEKIYKSRDGEPCDYMVINMDSLEKIYSLKKIKTNEVFLPIEQKELNEENTFATEIEEIEHLINSKKLTNTEKETIIKIRIGQGAFRDKLIKKWKGCQLTGCEHITLLKASHIKPWKDSDNRERLDVNNGLLLTPTYDTLFDKGFISFDKEGIMLVSDEIKSFMQTLTGSKKQNNIILSKKQEKYMAYHRDEIYK